MAVKPPTWRPFGARYLPNALSIGVEAPVSNASVSFVLVSRLKEWCFNPHRVEGIRIGLGSPEITISLRSANAAGSGQDGFDNLECKSSRVFPTTTEQADFVAGLAAGMYVLTPSAPVTLPVRVRGEERIDATGRILERMKIPFELYPPGVQSLWREAYATLRGTQERFLRLLRWLQDVDSPHGLYTSPPGLFWRSGKAEGEDHLITAAPEPERGLPGVDVRGIRGIVWDDALGSSLRGLWDEGAVEPLAHELLREARLLADTGSTRSALLMAATAVETGVKDHVGRLRPETRWILQNVPSPPIHKILRSYVHDMHAASPLVADWKVLDGLWSACGKLAEARNATTHSGAAADADVVERHIEVAADVLYVLDALAGQEWARRRVSTKLRKALGWPGPSEHRIVGTWGSTRWEIDPNK